MAKQTNSCLLVENAGNTVYV